MWPQTPHNATHASFSRRSTPHCSLFTFTNMRGWCLDGFYCSKCSRLISFQAWGSLLWPLTSFDCRDWSNHSEWNQISVLLHSKVFTFLQYNHFSLCWVGAKTDAVMYCLMLGCFYFQFSFIFLTFNLRLYCLMQLNNTIFETVIFVYTIFMLISKMCSGSSYHIISS